ncbi:MAG: hypothetical protein CO182_10350, partial [Lysobacterales bacterium CG_4_9_14_3_um_filter_62_6]
VNSDNKALKKLTAAESAAMVKTANADFDVATTEADARFSIAEQKCGAVSGVDKDACLSAANAVLAVDRATATAQRDAALAQAEHHD